MARLYEYQGKRVLADHGIAVPAGTVITEPDGIRQIPRFPVVLKAQVWTTSRMAQGLIRFAGDSSEAREEAAALLATSAGSFPVESVLVEERLAVEAEYFLSYFIDDAAGKPRFLFSPVAGSGVEAALRERPEAAVSATVDLDRKLYRHRIADLLRTADIHGKELAALSELVRRAIEAAVAVEARSLEINPIVKTRDGRFVAADCRITVDDNAVFRHPDLGIDIARELSRPPTELDRIAYRVEEKDYRGTFYFVQLAWGLAPSDRYVGFHGSGGGGSMMGMDALSKYGLRPANFCDTSGNPAASKVYRAARIIASQPGIVGYFGTGSGVASQEQLHSARGLVKAFREMDIDIPVVMRLGGNMEEEAVELLESHSRDLSAPVRGFTKDTSASACAKVLAELIQMGGADPPPESAAVTRRAVRKPDWLDGPDTYRFDTPTGRIHYHHPTCLSCASKACVSACDPRILKLEEGKPVLAVTEIEAARGKCTECLACQIECERFGAGGGFVNLPVAGLDPE